MEEGSSLAADDRVYPRAPISHAVWQCMTHNVDHLDRESAIVTMVTTMIPQDITAGTARSLTEMVFGRSRSGSLGQRLGSAFFLRNIGKSTEDLLELPQERDSEMSSESKDQPQAPRAGEWQQAVWTDWQSWTSIENSLHDRQLAGFAEAVQDLLHWQLDRGTDARSVIEQLGPTLTDCDRLAFDSDAEALAYALWHLSDRYGLGVIG
ncbi:MAG: hypothetical protein ABIZ05_15795 [Pseudonocardiaceae bacterium]